MDKVYRPLSEPIIIHYIGGQVLTIEVSTHADVGDINMHCTAIFGKARQRAVYTIKLLTFFTELITEFHMSLDLLDLQYDITPWETHVQKRVYINWTQF